MPSLQVRELPERVYRKLVEAAEREHRSLAQQAVEVLARGLELSQDARSRRRRIIERIRSRPGIKGSIPDPIELIRADRHR